MNGQPVELPNLDALVAEPVKAMSLPPDDARTLLCGLASLLPVLIAQASKVEIGTHQVPSEKFLTVKEASRQFGVTPRWLYSHKRQLPHSQPSRKILLFPEDRLKRWFAGRKAS